MSTRFRFNPAKALEAILYVARRAGTDKYATLKILYLADKLHLARYGRFIAGDYYSALEDGPTPMLSYDIIQYAAGVKDRSPIDSRAALRVGEGKNPHTLVALREANLDELSDSDIECLDEVIVGLDGVPSEKKYKVMWDDVHDPAWKRAWEDNRNGRMEVEEIAKLFPNSEELLDYLHQS